MYKRYRKLLVLLLTILILWMGLPFFIPDTLSIRASTEIDAPAQVVFVQINDLRNWEYWANWNRHEEMTAPVYNRGGMGAGGSAEWTVTGETSLIQRFTLVKSQPYQFIELAMDFPGQAFLVTRIDLRENGNKTILSWNAGMKSDGWKSFFFWLDARKTVKKAVLNLAASAELWHAQQIQIVEQGIVSEFPYVSIRRQVPWDELSDTMAAMFEQLIQASGNDTYTITGHPYAIYHAMGEEKADLECGFPVNNPVKIPGIILSGFFRETDCALTEYKGNYDQLEKGHEAIQQWIKDRGFILTGPPMEIFVTSASETQHPDEWVTRICYPLDFR
jgi:effector-binding domain-containing protein